MSPKDEWEAALAELDATVEKVKSQARKDANALLQKAIKGASLIENAPQKVERQMIDLIKSSYEGEKTCQSSIQEIGDKIEALLNRNRINDDYDNRRVKAIGAAILQMEVMKKLSSEFQDRANDMEEHLLVGFAIQKTVNVQTLLSSDKVTSDPTRLEVTRTIYLTQYDDQVANLLFPNNEFKSSIVEHKSDDPNLVTALLVSTIWQAHQVRWQQLIPQILSGTSDDAGSLDSIAKRFDSLATYSQQFALVKEWNKSRTPSGKEKSQTLQSIEESFSQLLPEFLAGNSSAEELAVHYENLAAAYQMRSLHAKAKETIPHVDDSEMKARLQQTTNDSEIILQRLGNQFGEFSTKEAMWQPIVKRKYIPAEETMEIYEALAAAYADHAIQYDLCARHVTDGKVKDTFKEMSGDARAIAERMEKNLHQLKKSNADIKRGDPAETLAKYDLPETFFRYTRPFISEQSKEASIGETPEEVTSEETSPTALVAETQEDPIKRESSAPTIVPPIPPTQANIENEKKEEVSIRKTPEQVTSEETSPDPINKAVEKMSIEGKSSAPTAPPPTLQEEKASVEQPPAQANIENKKKTVTLEEMNEEIERVEAALHDQRARVDHAKQNALPYEQDRAAHSNCTPGDLKGYANAVATAAKAAAALCKELAMCYHQQANLKANLGHDDSQKSRLLAVAQEKQQAEDEKTKKTYEARGEKWPLDRTEDLLAEDPEQTLYDTIHKAGRIKSVKSEKLPNVNMATKIKPGKYGVYHEQIFTDEYPRFAHLKRKPLFEYVVHCEVTLRGGAKTVVHGHVFHPDNSIVDVKKLLDQGELVCCVFKRHSEGGGKLGRAFEEAETAKQTDGKRVRVYRSDACNEIMGQLRTIEARGHSQKP
ncbi:MAG: hypothetical protein V4568_02665 [Pseudomonadota bacterium]